MRRPTLHITLAALCALLAPAAAEARGFEVSGGGFGHGVGMSQYGAYGLALEGRSHGWILGHYYTGSELGEVRGERVRVLLQASRPGAASFSSARRVGGRRLNPDRTYSAEAVRGSRMVVRTAGGRRVAGSKGPLAVSGERRRVRLGGEALNGVSGGVYRGRLEFRPGLLGGVTAVNELALDSYVRGVIAREMPASWHPEALAAQAVAARSYAVATRSGSDIFDHYPDTRSQVYGGVGAETGATNRAVRQTAHTVVLHRGEVAQTFFSSSSGGHTEDVENVFGGPAIPYLRGVPDRHDDISPLHRWSYRFSRSELERRLGSLVAGRFQGLDVLERGASPRIVRARVRGSSGSTTVSGTTLQQRLGTYDIPTSVERGGGMGSAARGGGPGSGTRDAGAARGPVGARGAMPLPGAVVPLPPKG